MGKSPDISGQVYGRLTVIGRSDKRGKRGKRTVMLWECRCECGAITYKAKDTLTNPSVSMCADCAAKYAVSKAREKAGFIEGTQISKILVTTPLSSNASGHRGIYYEKKFNRWRAGINFQGKRYYLGTFRNFDDAVKARQKAEARLYVPFLEKLNEAERGKNHECNE